MKLGELTSLVSRKNKTGQCGAVYSVTNSQGFIPSTEYFSKEVFSKELKTYKLVGRSQIAYNPSRINVGSVALQDREDEVVVSPLYVVFSVDQERLDPAYLLRFLKSGPGLSQIAFQSIGTVRNNLKYDGLSNILLHVPPLEEQRLRIRTLVSLEGQIETCRSFLSRLDALVKSRFVEMFGDPVDSMKWSTEKLGDAYCVKSSKRIYAKEQTEQGVPFFRLADIGVLIETGMADSGLFISEERYEGLKSAEQVPMAGDVLVTARGTLGRCYVVKPDDRFYFQDGMITWLAQTEKSPLPIFLTSVFQNQHFNDWLNESCSGTTVKYLSISDLAEVKIPVPPLSLQQEFADFVAQVDKSRFVVQLLMGKYNGAMTAIEKFITR